MNDIEKLNTLHTKLQSTGLSHEEIESVFDIARRYEKKVDTIFKHVRSLDDLIEAKT